MPQVRVREKQFRNTDLRKMQRQTFAAVMDAYDNIKSVLGNAQAIDYSRMTGGQGAQFSTDNAKGLALLDYTIDVERTIKNTLNAPELKYYLDNLVGQSFPLKVDTEESMAIQEKLGRMFYARGMYPVRKYFVTIKR